MADRQFRAPPPPNADFGNRAESIQSGRSKTVQRYGRGSPIGRLATIVAMVYSPSCSSGPSTDYCTCRPIADLIVFA